MDVTLLIVDSESQSTAELSEYFSIDENRMLGEHRIGFVRHIDQVDYTLEYVNEVKPQIIVADLCTDEDHDGYSFLRRLKARTPASKIVAMVGEDRFGEDCAAGHRKLIKAGVDHILLKPVNPGRLHGIVEVLARAYADSIGSTYRIGEFLFHPGKNELRKGQARVNLPLKECELLRYLITAGRPVLKKELLTEIWGYASATCTHTVETHVYRLRQKLEPNPRSPRILVTMPGAYYAKS